MDDDRARELLTASLAELDANRRFAERNRAEIAADPEPEGVLGMHPGDQGTELTDAEGAELLDAFVGEQRRQVTDALARLDGGTYGQCLVCGQVIDEERLEARPEARTCREHADSPVVT
jgi:RNA polymerase-binding transcription factor DksA